MNGDRPSDADLSYDEWLERQRKVLEQWRTMPAYGSNREGRRKRQKGSRDTKALRRARGF